MNDVPLVQEGEAACHVQRDGLSQSRLTAVLAARPGDAPQDIVSTSICQCT